MNLKKQVEAILFSAGRKIEVEEIAKLVETNEASVKKVLREIKKDFDGREAPTMILEEGTAWKMTVREDYLGTVRKITPYMEFSKSLMETLAVVAWKQPIMQSDVIKVRTNKAYDHIQELEKMGFLAKEKHGRSYLLKLSQKFYDYFALRDDVDVRNLFKHVKDGAPVQKKVDEFKEKEAEVLEEPEVDEFEKFAKDLKDDTLKVEDEITGEEEEPKEELEVEDEITEETEETDDKQETEVDEEIPDAADEDSKQT